MLCPKCSLPLDRRCDPPSAGGFEYTLFECPVCQGHFMYCFCVAASRGVLEPVALADAAAIFAPDQPDLRALMRAWQARVVG